MAYLECNYSHIPMPRQEELTCEKIAEWRKTILQVSERISETIVIIKLRERFYENKEFNGYKWVSFF